MFFLKATSQTSGPVVAILSQSFSFAMRIKKLLKKLIISFLLIAIGLLVWVSFTVFPAISGYCSKNLCSAVYLQHRDPKDVKHEDLSGFPLSLGTFKVNKEDSSVTGSVFGIAKRKTVFREGCGCTVINDFSEEQVRSQQFFFPAKPVVNNDSIPWPIGDKLPDSLPTNINGQQLKQAVNNVMNEKSENGKSKYTRAVLVIYNGNIVAENYAPGFSKHTLMLGWSMSKSLTAALIGILVKENKLTVDAPAPMPAWANTEKSGITIKNLLQQTTGIAYTEIYTKPSSVTKMLFSKGNMAEFASSLPLKHAPGTVFNYSGGNTNILSKIIREVVGEKDYSEFPYKELFHKINAYSFLLEPDASGTYIGSSYSYATTRDFARFGLLYYNNGKWNGEQLLPEDWVKKSTQPSTADKRKQYGYQFWLNGYDEKDSTKLSYPDVPPDMYFANGYGGQNIYIIPSKKLIVVRLGLYRINANKFLKEVIQSIHD